MASQENKCMKILATCGLMKMDILKKKIYELELFIQGNCLEVRHK